MRCARTIYNAEYSTHRPLFQIEILSTVRSEVPKPDRGPFFFHRRQPALNEDIAGPREFHHRFGRRPGPEI